MKKPLITQAIEFRKKFDYLNKEQGEREAELTKEREKGNKLWKSLTAEKEKLESDLYYIKRAIQTIEA